MKFELVEEQSEYKEILDTGALYELQTSGITGVPTL